MLVISTREFRDKQGKYLSMAAKGEAIVLKSRGKGSFKLVPVSDDDTLMSKEEFESAIERGLQNIKNGKTKRYTMEELHLKMGL